jgi:lipoprotein-anchoring transpeptidase ErfK/SrfK
MFLATKILARATAVAALACVAFGSSASAQPFAFASSGARSGFMFDQVITERMDRDRGGAPTEVEVGEAPARFRRQVVDYPTREAPGTIVVDTPNTYLYYVMGGGKAMRYGIGVGREGFTWSGVKHIERKAEWPDWTPPPEMLARQPYLPRFMAGGPGNPLGARAMYIGGTIYRIHGTNAPASIGTRVSSGCIRMVNDDVVDLYSRVNVGTKVVVLPMTQRYVGGRSNLY